MVDIQTIFGWFILFMCTGIQHIHVHRNAKEENREERVMGRRRREWGDVEKNEELEKMGMRSGRECGEGVENGFNRV